MIMHIINCLIATILSLSPALDDGKTKGDRMEIILDIFSGRPNPTWKLNEDETKEFVAKFKSLKPGDSEKRPFKGLGYRGFKVTGFQDYDLLTVWKDVVEGQRGEKTFHWRDGQKSLEKYLLKCAKDHVDQAIYQSVESAIDKN
jgi:hypothetical protein